MDTYAASPPGLRDAWRRWGKECWGKKNGGSDYLLHRLCESNMAGDSDELLLTKVGSET